MSSELDELLIEILNLDSASLSDDLTMDMVDEWDSLRHMELIFALEESAGVQFSPDEIATMNSVGGIRRIFATRSG